MDWEAPTHELAMREPRHGCRAALAATVHTPAGPLLAYCLHLEVIYLWRPDISLNDRAQRRRMAGPSLVLDATL